MRQHVRILLLVLLFCLFSVLGVNGLYEYGYALRLSRLKLDNTEYREFFYSNEMWEREEFLSTECGDFLRRVRSDCEYFPIPESSLNPFLTVTFVDSWMGERNYRGKRGHEGTDIMAAEDEPGLYPVLSVSDGTVTSLGWLEKGGWRVGVTSDNNVYYYYAHLDSYASALKEGDEVQAGQLLGFMGDSGYGPEGTTGQFATHLHFGIYSYETGKEISFNPYYLLKTLEKRKLKHSYF